MKKVVFSFLAGVVAKVAYDKYLAPMVQPKINEAIAAGKAKFNELTGKGADENPDGFEDVK